ncbi:hypothetical protein C8Q77DRAFT_1215149 [Trametes polyzona]|nr:hypothetical protein C8Q77DRAFT_1215149 [Trametes polyzona]
MTALAPHENPISEKGGASVHVDHELEADRDSTYITVSHLDAIAPPGWLTHVHPRGARYWTNPKYHVVVHDDIGDPSTLQRANDFCNQCAAFDLPPGMEVHMIGGMDTSFCLYVNHNQGVAGYELAKVKSIAVRDMAVNALLRARRLYWAFIHLHPSHHPCPPQGFEEAIDALRSYYHEHIQAGSRTFAPFSKRECEELLGVLHSMKGEEPRLPATISLLGWILKDVYSSRPAQKYGLYTHEQLKAFRESAHQAPELTRQPSALTRLVVLGLIHGPFFGIPQTYLAHVKSASEFRGHLDGLKDSWQSYTLQLVREYSDFILIATVLLSATVGLLTIDDIGEPCRVAAMLSAFAALGSMTVGVFLVWLHQRNTRMPSSFSYLHNARNNPLGLSGHALLLSLPPVLLVWSIVGFTAATLAYALQDTMRASTWVILGLFVILFVAVLAGLYTFSTIWHWQSQEGWWSWFNWKSRRQREEGRSSTV